MNIKMLSADLPGTVPQTVLQAGLCCGAEGEIQATFKFAETKRRTSAEVGSRKRPLRSTSERILGISRTTSLCGSRRPRAAPLEQASRQTWPHFVTFHWENDVENA